VSNLERIELFPDVHELPAWFYCGPNQFPTDQLSVSFLDRLGKGQPGNYPPLWYHTQIFANASMARKQVRNLPSSRDRSGTVASML
jgi:hypothetical protein